MVASYQAVPGPPNLILATVRPETHNELELLQWLAAPFSSAAAYGDRP